MSKLGVYFKELVPKTSIDTANSVNFVIYDPVKDIDLRVGLTQIQNYLQDNLLFREGDKQVHDITDVVKTGDNFTSIGTTVNSYKPDDVYIVTPSVANTGASNFSINAFPSLPLLKMSDNTVTYLEPGDFKNTSVILYRTTHFLLFSSNGNEEKVLETVTAGELLNIGNIITPSNDGKWYKADCFTEAKTEGPICYVTQPIQANAKGSVVRIGVIDTSGVHVLIPGGEYFVGVNGNISHDGVPDNDPVFLKKIGKAITTSKLDFNPSMDFAELTTVSEASAEFPDAPSTGIYYARKDGQWVNVEEIMLLNALMY